MTLLQVIKPAIAQRPLSKRRGNGSKGSKFNRLCYAEGSASLSLAKAISVSGLAVSFLGLFLSFSHADMTGPFLLAAAGLYFISWTTSLVESGADSAMFCPSNSRLEGKQSMIWICRISSAWHGLKRAWMRVCPGSAKASKPGAAPFEIGFRMLLFFTACCVTVPLSLAIVVWFSAAHHQPLQAAGRGLVAPRVLSSHEAYAPSLQGATNGTIGALGRDACYVTGVNTCGMVRIDNLANVEALLNVVANAIEVLGLSWGVTVIIYSVVKQAAALSETITRVSLGSASVYLGLSTPGLINWLLATARDANLFS